MSVPRLQDMTALILAGGKGTRIAALYPDIPKPMIPVNGQPFLHWVIQWVMRQGITRIVISTGHLAEKIEEWVASKPFGDTCEIVCRREAEPLGTGGGIRNCLDLLSEWTLVTNGDSLIMKDIFGLIDPGQFAGVDAAIFGVRVDDTSRFGSLQITPDGLLSAFAEKVPGQGLINSGIYLIKKCIIKKIDIHRATSIEREIFPNLIAQGVPVGVQVIVDAKIIDIGTPEGINYTTNLLKFIRTHKSNLGVFLI